MSFFLFFFESGEEEEKGGGGRTPRQRLLLLLPSSPSLPLPRFFSRWWRRASPATEGGAPGSGASFGLDDPRPRGGAAAQARKKKRRKTNTNLFFSFLLLPFYFPGLRPRGGTLSSRTLGEFWIVFLNAFGEGGGRSKRASLSSFFFSFETLTFFPRKKNLIKTNPSPPPPPPIPLQPKPPSATPSPATSSTPRTATMATS